MCTFLDFVVYVSWSDGAFATVHLGDLAIAAVGD